MKTWRVEIWVTGVDDEDVGTSRQSEFERDDRDAALGFATSELLRLIEEIAAEDHP